MKYLVAIGMVLALLFAGCIGTGAQAPQQSAEDKAMAEKKAMEAKAMAEKKAMEEKAAMEAKAMAEKKAMEEKNAMMEKNNSSSAMEKEEETGAMMEKNSSNGSVMGKAEGAMMESGKASYSPYSAEAYQKAKSEGKVIYLEFYASWCPDCRAYEPRLLSGFETMAADSKYKDVVGFKVNYDTQDDLKREFGIVGQHTHVILGKNGNVVVKSRETWSSQDLMDNIGKAL